ncbi:GvpL/GvpF family gas vesicle protein [Streptomyces sp. DSM 44938]|uniref:GvpL/GvpF family gas vesicle protein n=1 Tax=Streptomyces litchfieldiae TaxID=3075543 RepID=A0ABU2MIJ6_9ACTN|nr:GvpL/GvpF family gas vesicle protein [Streptomyces sp. DSM 44938]MDT0341417.1 GvpL/GvpF family gas vesicle protein [Streptomyces sp. DSM 44938]
MGRQGVRRRPGARRGAAARPRPGSPRSGRAYLDRVRARQRSREARQEDIRRAAEHVDAALRALATEARRLRPHGPALTGDQGPQVLNAATWSTTTGRPN